MKIHIVRPGEVFEQLVQKYNVPFERLLEANPNLNEEVLLEAGTKIRIPTGKVPLFVPKEQKEEALVEELTPIFLEPVPLDETELSWELEEEWEEADLEDIEDEFEDEFEDDDDLTSIAAPFAPVFPTQPGFQPYFSISGYDPFPILPYPMYQPPVYPPATYSHYKKVKKESSSTVYR
ncbi:LysM peptidoglycan-binding domain-containing protein [Shimazuella kribbensis]|uniref:LysM peptidoglycan-binding domain-containing protein n=1 Tax=Shimazuella kribbensis TaxID=139808 RepID=UPI0003FC01EF|nr:LysM domain-containing protein [Shimazuella kribbensis]